MNLKLYIFIILIVFLSSCEYDVSVESNSNGITISQDLNNKNESRKDIKFVASSEKVIEAGEIFELKYSINENVSNFTPPDFKNFNIISGPFTSSSSSTSYINGKRSSKISNSYIYNISANKPGTFQLEPAEIIIDGNTYKSNILEIKVIGGEVQENNNSQNQNKNIKTDEDVFLITNYSKTNIYKGEYIVATTKIYTRKDFQNISEIKFPDYDGFWTEVLKAPRQINFENEEINGKIYNSGLLKQILIFSQSPGNYNIAPYEIELQIKKKDGKTRDFFGNIVDKYKLINKKIKTKKQVLTVRPLPQPIPVNFSGVTGNNIIINAKIDNTNIKTDESANLQINVSGNGNLHLLNELKLNLPENIDHFKPQVEKNEKYSEKGAYTEKIFNYIIVANKAGIYNLPPFDFVYFDTKTESYKTVSSSKITLNVGKGSGYVNPTESNTNINVKDIRHIKTNNLNLNKKGEQFAGSLFYYLTFITLTILFVIFLIIRKKRIDENKDVLNVKRKNANKVSQKRLKNAKKYMQADKTKEFYSEILSSLWGYLSDKMSINSDALTKESIKILLEEKNIEEKIINKLENVIEICGYAQYSPVGEEAKPETIYKEAEYAINELESYLLK